MLLLNFCVFSGKKGADKSSSNDTQNDFVIVSSKIYFWNNFWAAIWDGLASYSIPVETSDNSYTFQFHRY